MADASVLNDEAKEYAEGMRDVKTEPCTCRLNCTHCIFVFLVSSCTAKILLYDYGSTEHYNVGEQYDCTVMPHKL